MKDRTVFVHDLAKKAVSMEQSSKNEDQPENKFSMYAFSFPWGKT
jgi:hypothetical protein